MPCPPDALEARLGHVFADKSLLLAALTHPSYAAEHPADAPSDNQRLEFLGDAALGLAAAEHLFLTQPGWHEGRLTKVRSRLANETALARVARALELGAHLRLGRGEERSGGRDTPSILADALEAVIGALWLDGGPVPVRILFETHFADLLREALADATEINPKGELQELVQARWQDHPEYTLLSAEGPPHRRIYRVAVSHRGTVWAEGEGTGIRRAESAAAAAALALLRKAGDE